MNIVNEKKAISTIPVLEVYDADSSSEMPLVIVTWLVSCQSCMFVTQLGNYPHNKFITQVAFQQRLMKLSM